MLYDGVCGLCSRLLQFLLEHDRRGVFTFRLAAKPDGTDDESRVGAAILTN